MNRERADRPIPPGWRQEWAREWAVPLESTGVSHTTLFAFRLGAEWFGLEPACVREVTRVPRARTLPHADAQTVVGLVIVRGKAIVLIRLAEFLKVRAVTETRGTGQMLVLRDGSWHFAVIAEEVAGFLHLPAPALVSASSFIGPGKSAGYVRGWWTEPGRSGSWLDRGRLFSDLRARSI